MPTPSLPTLGDDPNQRQILDYIVKLQRDLEWLLGNLDSLNVRKLTADVIDAGTLNADLVTIRSDLTSGYIQIDGNGMVVNNGSYDTFEVDINGNVVMTSARIRSALGYPYVELDPTGNLLGAYASAGKWVAIYPVGSTGTPQLTFSDDSTTSPASSFMWTQPDSWSSGVTSFTIDSTKFIRLTPGGTSPFTGNSWILCDGDLHLFDFDDLYSISDGQNLQQALNAKAGAFSGYSGSVSAGTSTLHFSNGILTSVT